MKTRRFFTAFLIALVLATTGASTFAADHTTTSTNFNWEKGSAGWNTGSTWADGDNATFTINSAVAHAVYFNSDIVADALTVTWGGNHNVAFTLNLQDYYDVELEEFIEPKLTANSLVINGYNNQITSIINGVLEVHNGITVTNSRLTIGSGGTLIAHSNITSTGFISVANGGTLVLDAAGTGMTINQAVTITDGAAGAIKSVRGNNFIQGLVTIGANSSPGLVVESGSLSINGLVSKATVNGMARVQVKDGATLQVGPGGISAASGAPLYLYGGGVIELYGSLTNTGIVEIGVPAGVEEITTTIRLMSSDFASAGILSISARAILEIPEGVNITLNRTPTTGIISGTGTLLVKGTLDMLNGYNLGFSGNTHIDGGRVNLYGVGRAGNNYYSFGEGTISFANGGILDLSGIDPKVDGSAFYATIDLNGGTIYMRGNQNIPYGDLFNPGTPAITNGDKGVVFVDMEGVANGSHCLFYGLDYRTVNFEFINLSSRQRITWVEDFGYDFSAYTLSSVSFASVALGNTVTVPSGPITVGEYDHVAGTLNVETGGTATVYGDVSGTVNVTGGVLHIGGAMSLDNQSITGVVQALGAASSNAMVSVDAPRGVIVQGSGSVGAGLISLRNGIIYEGTELSDNINTLTSTLFNYHGTADVVIDGTAQDDDQKAVIDGLFLADGASLSAAEARGHSLVITGSVTGSTDGEKSSQLILGADTLGMHQICSAELQDIQVVVSGGHHLVIRDTHLDSGVSLLVDATSSVELGGTISISARGVALDVTAAEDEITTSSAVEASGLTVSFDFIDKAPTISDDGVLFVLDFANLTDVSWQALLDEAKAAFNDGTSTVYSFGIELGDLSGIDVTSKSVFVQFTYPTEWGYVLSFNDTMNLSQWDWANGVPDQMFLFYIPEPTTATLGMFGLAGLLLRRRRMNR